MNNTNDLSEIQNEDVSILWPNHMPDPDPSFPSSSSTATTPYENAYPYMVRYVNFFVTILLNIKNNNDLYPCTIETLNPLLLFKADDENNNNDNNILQVRLLDNRQIFYFDFQAFELELLEFEKRNDNNSFNEYNGSIGEYLHNNPDEAISSLQCSIGICMSTLYRRQERYSNNSSNNLNSLGEGGELQRTIKEINERVQRSLQRLQIIIRLYNLYSPYTLRMSDVKTNMVHKCISIRGHVTRAKAKRLRVLSSDFQCCKCGEQISYNFRDGKYNVPDKCITKKCRSRQFSLLRCTSKYIDYQSLKLQELQDETQEDTGRTPKNLEIELLGNDLMDVCHAGDIICVVGIVKPMNTALASGKTGKRALETSTYTLYIKANSIMLDNSNNKNNNDTAFTSAMDDQGGNFDNNGGVVTPGSTYSKGDASTSVSKRARVSSNSAKTTASSFSTTQLERIIALAHSDPRVLSLTFRRSHPFHLLVRSICPSIIGHELVKAGILLALLGGTTPPISATGGGSHGTSNSANTIRSNIHVLVVGDPGMGKSQMLLAASQLTERSVYVGGNTASTSGLTVALTKETGGEMGIEAGALVLADQGICCIDEFDKMAKNNQDGLLEAMEQQQISIAKAGVVASLPSRCSVIAAANPKQGNYNLNKTIAENINMSSPLLSRFDLVFILRDNADLEHDIRVSTNIMNLYTDNNTPSKTKDKKQKNNVNKQHNNNDFIQDESGWIPLEWRLKYVSEKQKEPLPANLLRDYISYARQYCNPKLTSAAAEVLKHYFMQLRHPTNFNQNNSVPITTRQLEALIRLSQARAKACLREFVLEEDARDVVDLMSQSVKQVHINEAGVIEKDRGGAGGRSKRKKKRIFINALKEQMKRTNIDMFSIDDLRWIALKSLNIDCNNSSNGSDEFNSLISELREENELLRNSNGTYSPV